MSKNKQLLQFFKKRLLTSDRMCADKCHVRNVNDLVYLYSLKPGKKNGVSFVIIML